MRRSVECLMHGLAAGALVGATAWSGAQHAYRRDLFNRHPLRRLLALGHLAGRPSLATAQLLREYVAWERQPTLRTRARQTLRTVEQALA